MTEFGIAVPEQFPSGLSVDVAEIRRWLDEAERAGLHNAWVMEGITGPKPQLEPVSLLSYVAATTTRLRLGLGLGVTLLPLRSPVRLAKALASLDQLCRGRLIVGAGSCATAEFKQQVDIIGEEFARTGQDRENFAVVKRVYIAVDDNASRARGILGDWFGHLYGNRDRADGAVAAGPIDACVEFINGVVEAGASLIILNPVAEETHQTRRLAGEIVPALRP